ncbi:MAG: GGDEF domain-containing protein [Labilithrix sp.]|nr:GGDEF domain-containing protein [Labilithrix sp.]MCW5815008.1 GGDEF domain-containing protein [Labilithrix sp.]
MSGDQPPRSRADKTRAIEAQPHSARRHGVFIVAAGFDAGQVLVLTKDGMTTLGRAKECQFSFEDQSLSREHAIVMRAGGAYILKDTSTNGTFVNEQRLTTVAELRDGDRVQLGTSTFLRFQFVDDQEEIALRRVFEAAHLDGLTGVYNRKHLEERLTAELAYATRHEEPLSIIIIDVDHFKKVNDTLGHLAGDAVLKHMSALLKRLIRPEDILARYGGEEFVVIARGTDVAQAEVLAERLRAAVEAETIHFDGKDIKITSSGGVASLACCGESRDRATLLGTADKRLYAAKQGGRNRVVGP